MTLLGPSDAQLRALIGNAAHGVILTDEAGAIRFHNSAAAQLFGCGDDELCGVEIGVLIPADLGTESWETIGDVAANRVLAFAGSTLDFRAFRRDGSEFIANVTVGQLGLGGEVAFTLEVRDVSQQVSRENEQERLLVHLAQSHKLESVGRLAAGIAHEINTPVQYVGDNLQFLSESLVSLQGVLNAYRDAARGAGGAESEAALAACDRLADELDLEYLTEEMPRAIAQALEGTSHIADIVSAMKEFCHPGRAEKGPIDLNEAIENAISVSRNEWKYVARIETELADDLPRVVCNENEIKQVLLNLVVNAAHAIAEKDGPQSGIRGTIRVATRRRGRMVEIEIADDGPGIPEHAMPRLFDPFFTTKDAGKGTGQGLAIAHSIVVERHRGDIRVQSAPGHGARFVLRLPL